MVTIEAFLNTLYSLASYFNDLHNQINKILEVLRWDQETYWKTGVSWVPYWYYNHPARLCYWYYERHSWWASDTRTTCTDEAEPLVFRRVLALVLAFYIDSFLKVVQHELKCYLGTFWLSCRKYIDNLCTRRIPKARISVKRISDRDDYCYDSSIWLPFL